MVLNSCQKLLPPDQAVLNVYSMRAMNQSFRNIEDAGLVDDILFLFFPYIHIDFPTEGAEKIGQFSLQENKVWQ